MWYKFNLCCLNTSFMTKRFFYRIDSLQYQILRNPCLTKGAKYAAKAPLKLIGGKAVKREGQPVKHKTEASLRFASCLQEPPLNSLSCRLSVFELANAGSRAEQSVKLGKGAGLHKRRNAFWVKCMSEGMDWNCWKCRSHLQRLFECAHTNC